MPVSSADAPDAEGAKGFSPAKGCCPLPCRIQTLLLLEQKEELCSTAGADFVALDKGLVPGDILPLGECQKQERGHFRRWQ